MTTAQQHTDNLLFRMKHLKEFVVHREFDFIPAGVVKFNIQHTVGHPAKIFVHALTQKEAEQQVNDWFEQGAA
jgi:hypothetical protein